ncbi:MAG TPA: DoxX family protein [Saprospiraceae bacterium]|nr:DoxX family protein [Saprospiraceae bacterium]HMQ83247.1 DoxX family protein [Saprospiraceae bacterium]
MKRTYLNSILSPAPIYLNQALAFIRVFVGGLLAFHGVEVFNPTLMQEYAQWEAFAGSQALTMVYLGKSAELVSGILLLLGLLTRVGALIAIGALSYITFFVGSGRFWYEDQHPFMFVLFGILFLFTGPGAWSLDKRIFK